MKVAFLTLGCKVNQYETQILKQYFIKDGFEIASEKSNADIYVINSCTVTANSDRKTRQIINRWKKQSPNAVIALTGCMPQAFPEEAIVLPDVDVVTGAYNRKGLVDAIKKNISTGEKVFDITNHTKDTKFEQMALEDFSERTRAFVKIQDGCERFCAYCIIPTARGSLRSKPLLEIEKEISNLAKNDYKEIVFVGINLSCYGVDINSNLIEAIVLCSKVSGIERIRLGSLEPELLERDKLINLSKIEKFCPQFHLSLQSGSDDTLKRMSRHYDTKAYTEIVKNIRDIFDNPSITTDVMVGFPFETEKEFNESLEYVKSVGFTKTHVFSYSKRKGTKADLMDNQVDSETKAKRNREMIKITKESQKDFLKTQINLIEEVLFETNVNGKWHGYTKNYISVFVKTEKDLSNKIKNVKIVKAYDNFCDAIII